MKKENLTAMGLTEVQAEMVMDALDGSFVTKARFNEVNEELKTQRSAAADLGRQLEKLRIEAEDAEMLKKQVEALQAQNRAQAEAHAAEIRHLRIEMAVEKALTDSKAKNHTAVRALLKGLDEAVLNEDGTVKGLQKQIDALIRDDSTSFLFDTAVPEFRGFKPQEGGTSAVDTSQMTYSQMMAYLAAHPGAQI